MENTSPSPKEEGGTAGRVAGRGGRAGVTIGEDGEEYTREVSNGEGRAIRSGVVIRSCGVFLDSPPASSSSMEEIADTAEEGRLANLVSVFMCSFEVWVGTRSSCM